MKALFAISLFGLVVSPVSTVFAAQPAGDKKPLSAQDKFVAERAAAIKEGLKSGNALFLVLRDLPGDNTAALIRLLDDPKVNRQEVLGSLVGQYGASPLVFPIILKVLEKEENFALRQAAVGALSRHEHHGVPVLLSVLKTAKADATGKDTGLRTAALEALENLMLVRPGSDAQATLLALKPGLKDEAADVRAAVVTAIGRLPRREEKGRGVTHPGLAELLAALKDADAKVREVAAKSLGQHRGPADLEKIIPALLELALSNHTDMATGAPRWYAIHALVSMGDQGIRPLLELDWGRGDRRVAIQGALVQALGASRYKSEAALPFLLDNIGDQHVVYALSQINYGAAAEKAIPELTALLENRVDFHRVFALEALFAVGPKGPPAAVEALKTKLTVRAAILYRLQKAEFRAKEAVPVLITCLEDKSATVRALAAERLGAIGPDARAALAALDLAIDDPDASVRIVAQEAMKRIKK